MVNKVKILDNEFGQHRRARTRSPGITRRARPARSHTDEHLDVRKALEARLKEAGAILPRVPAPAELHRLAGVVATWPTMIHSREDHAAWTVTRTRPASPSGRELDRLDQVLGWLFVLDAERRSIVFAKMIGYGSRRIAAVDPQGRSASSIGRIYQAALTDLVTACIEKSLLSQ